MNRAETLLQLAKLCRGDRNGVPPHVIEPSGLDALDAVLPGGGWRAGTIVELMPSDIGIGELRLLAPALARITNTDRHVAFISPPFIPYAPALDRCGIQLDRVLVIEAQNVRDVLWCFEQTLRCKSFGAVLAWPASITHRDVRRLQLAAEAGESTGFLYRKPESAREASPAAVRLQLHATATGAVTIDVLKCRGARAGASIVVEGWRSGISEEAPRSRVFLPAT